jgi:transcription termination/antitermination protein NusG
VSDLGSNEAGKLAPLPWYALQVRSRREALVATQLEGQGYECFLPQYKSERRWSDRKKEVSQPLFPCYLFCRFDPHNRGPLLMTPGIQQIVGIGRTPMPVAENEIESIRQVLASGLPSQPWLYLQIGQRVRVNHGGLNNLEGILVNFKGSHRVVLSVALLQRSVAMEIDLAWVTPVNEAKRAPLSVVHERPATVSVLG